jgi:chlorite dismutase
VAYFPVLKASPDRLIGRDAAAEAVEEVETMFGERQDVVDVRGFYLTFGFRADADLMMWWIASSPDDLQDVLAAFLRTRLGRGFSLTRAFMGIHRPPEVAQDHVPAFLSHERPRRYLCTYPFVRTAEWYQLPRAERAALLREHGEMGREFPSVLANTTSGFGLGDGEWILAFESDVVTDLVDCLRRLRDATARTYTKEDVPFVTGIRRELREAVSYLV